MHMVSLSNFILHLNSEGVYHCLEHICMPGMTKGKGSTSSKTQQFRFKNYTSSVKFVIYI